MHISDMLELPMTVEEYLETIHKEYDKLFPTVPLLPGNIWFRRSLMRGANLTFKSIFHKALNLFSCGGGGVYDDDDLTMHTINMKHTLRFFKFQCY